jgi:hypothetical protein
MRIQQSVVALTSQRQAIQQHTVKETLQVWVDSPAHPDSTAARAEISNHGKRAAAALPADDTGSDLIGDPELRMLRMLFEKVFGVRIEVADLALDREPSSKAPVNDPPPAERVGWGVDYHYEEAYHEAEQTQVTAEGVVKTADGRALSFTLDLQMSREFFTHQQVDLRLGDAAKDPLVINFGGTAAQLAG